MIYGETPSQNPEFTPEQLAALRASAETFATLEAVTLSDMQGDDEDDDDLDKMKHELGFGSIRRYLQKDGREIEVYGLARFNAKSSNIEPLSHHVPNLPEEYRDLPVASYGGLISVKDMATPGLSDRYTIWNVCPGAPEPLAVITIDRRERREDFVEFEGTLKSKLVERIDALAQEADGERRETLTHAHDAVEDQVVLWIEGNVSLGGPKVLGADEAKKLGALLLEAEYIGTDEPQSS